MAEGVGVSKYDVGSTVYVPYEGGTHYQARVIKKEIRDHVIHDGTKAPMWFYLVHYMGWNKKYDEWVEEVGCAFENPESLIIPNKTKPKGGAAHAGASKFDYAKPQISIAIPGTLKQQLIEDHDAVKEDKNIPMPRSPCIISILDSYKEHARQQSQVTPDIDEQVAHGIRNYFDRTLALLLLYNEERAQADGLLKNGDSPSSIYGAEHLLRLFLKLPELLPIESSTEEQYRLLQTKLHELLDFLAQHRTDFFVSTSAYIPAIGPSTHTAAPQPAAAPAATPVAAPPAALAADMASAVAPAPGAVKLASQPPLSAAALAQQPPLSSAALSQQPPLSAAALSQHPPLSAAALAQHPPLSAAALSQHPPLSAAALAQQPPLSAAALSQHPPLSAAALAQQPQPMQH